MRILLEDVYKKVVNFLNKEKFEYIIIGGIAAGTLGEPRVTGDIDIDILLDKNKISDFLRKAKKTGFKVNEQKCRKSTREKGIFQINYGDFHIDFIIASIDLERQAFKRKKTVRLYNIEAFFPTPEDLILLKIIPARAQDLLDAKRVLARHKTKLDMKYLQTQARKLSDEAQDMRILNELRKLLKDV
ncbi:MAG: nucleotidyltransferase [Candidatus Omnitrophica bacterium]|nr:nucleotidyltransferase [Candidatus Omnitrophota bacterium]